MIRFFTPSIWRRVSGFYALLTLGMLASSAHAADFQIIDFPINAESGKEWTPRLASAPRQIIATDGMGYAEFTPIPVQEGEVLLVTIIFVEDAEGGPTVLWFANDGSQQMTLSANLGEGIEGSNQRTILVPGEQAAEGGRIMLSGDQSKILRVRFDWAAATEIVAGADQRPGSILLADRFLQASEVNGERPAGTADSWRGKVFEAALQDDPESLDGNIEIVVPLAEKVGDGLLTASFLGLPFDQGVAVWINGHNVGSLWAQVPSFTDPGYVAGEDGTPRYAGWRASSLLIPGGYLREGDNSFIFSVGDRRVYVKDASLQLRAPDAGESTESSLSSENQVDLEALAQTLPRP